MWPFGDEYDVFVVDYKIIIKQNLLYKRSALGAFMLFVIILVSVNVFSFTDFSALGNVLVVAIELALCAYLLYSQKSNGIIEIDNNARTIRVREKYDVDWDNVISIKISHEKGYRGYVYNYLSLISATKGKESSYHIITADSDYDEGHETIKIARLIAAKLGLTLIIEHPEPFSFRSLFRPGGPEKKIYH